MRALFKPSAAPGLEMIECAEPNPGPNDVKIRVEKTGICGTDLFSTGALISTDTETGVVISFLCHGSTAMSGTTTVLQRLLLRAPLNS